MGGLFGIYKAAESWVAKIPDRIHEKNIEELRSTLEKELSKFQITEENLYIKKIESFELFQKSWDCMRDSVKTDKIAEKKRAMEAAQKHLNEFLGKAIFYCDEETFKRVLAFRKFTNKYSKETSSSKTESAKSMMIMADIYLSMRKSLGYEDKLDRDSFLYLIINDWEEMKFKPEYKEAYEYKFDEYY